MIGLLWLRCWLMGLADGPDAVTLTDEFDRVATAARKAYGLGVGVELHGHEIFHAGGCGKECRLGRGSAFSMMLLRRLPRGMSG